MRCGQYGVKTLTQLVDDASTSSPRTNQVGLWPQPPISTMKVVLLKAWKLARGV